MGAHSQFKTTLIHCITPRIQIQSDPEAAFSYFIVPNFVSRNHILYSPMRDFAFICVTLIR